MNHSEKSEVWVSLIKKATEKIEKIAVVKILKERKRGYYLDITYKYRRQKYGLSTNVGSACPPLGAGERGDPARDMLISILAMGFAFREANRLGIPTPRCTKTGKIYFRSPGAYIRKNNS